MVEALSHIITGLGLSASAGLNAYIPLLIVALTARFTHLIRLNPPFSTLTNGWVLAFLVVLTLIEALVDKIPAVDTINDVVQTFVRPTAGAILFASSSNVIGGIHPVLAVICGILIAGAVHATKATARPLLTVSTAGTANPIVSTAEDVVSAVTSLLSILVPVLALLLILVGVLLFFRALSRMRARA